MFDDALPTSRPELVRQWQAATAYISEKTSSLLVSQVVAPLSDWLELLLNPALSPTMREDQVHDLQRRFIRRWETMAMHMLSGETGRMSRQAVREFTDITGGSKPYGPDLAHAFRSAMVALQNDAPTVEALDVLPQRDEVCTHVRLAATRQGRCYMPVISYSPLVEEEWQIIFQELPRMVNVTLSVEGVSLMWLIGTFVRNQSGGINLQPEVGYRLSGPGTRIKLLRLILGAEYHRHGEWLDKLAGAVEEHQRKAQANSLAQVSLHPVTVQLFPGSVEYVSYDPESLSPVGREISNRVAKVPRELPHKPAIFLETELSGVETVESLPPLPPPPEPEAVAEAVTRPPIFPSLSPTVRDSKEDAEGLRRKGQLALASDKTLAKKYLLASTMLDNSSVDVWMTLAQLASSEQEKKAFLREAEKLLGRGR